MELYCVFFLNSNCIKFIEFVISLLTLRVFYLNLKERKISNIRDAGKIQKEIQENYVFLYKYIRVGICDAEERKQAIFFVSEFAGVDTNHIKIIIGYEGYKEEKNIFGKLKYKKANSNKNAKGLFKIIYIPFMHIAFFEKDSFHEKVNSIFYVIGYNKEKAISKICLEQKIDNEIRASNGVLINNYVPVKDITPKYYKFKNIPIFYDLIIFLKTVYWRFRNILIIIKCKNILAFYRR